jgi:Flp pilus assembly protein TadG
VLKQVLRDETGSAIVEVFLFAIPAFLTLILIATSILSYAEARVLAENAAREAVRAVRVSENETIGRQRAELLIDTALSKYLNKLKVHITCDRSNCQDPGTRITVTIEGEVTNQLFSKGLLISKSESMPLWNG